MPQPSAEGRRAPLEGTDADADADSCGHQSPDRAGAGPDWTARSCAPPSNDRGQVGFHRDPTRAAPYDRVADLAAVSRAINGGRGATWGSPGPPLTRPRSGPGLHRP